MGAENGEALRMPADALLAAAEAGPTLRFSLLRFANVFMIQMSRTIMSSLAHSIDRRMARWILLYHDRVRGDEVRRSTGRAISHQFAQCLTKVRTDRTKN